MLDEKAKRKPDFNEDESVPVEFGDGQEWFLPRPTVDVFALFAGGKATRSVQSSFGPEFDAKVAGIEKTDGGDFFSAVAELGADLLLRNYDLTDADLSAIFRFRVGSDQEKWMGSVLSVANGREAPKA